jgi:hypothetical protein
LHPVLIEQRSETLRSNDDDCKNDANNWDEMHDVYHKDSSIGWRFYYWMIDYGKKHDPFDIEENSISILDRVSRIVFPISFIVVIFIYWNFYVYRAHNFDFN